MRCLILTDIHGNLPALRAVLATPQAASCQRIFSLGDHTGFGPRPGQVHRLLGSLGAVMLLGNHEARLCRMGEADFAGYNWALARWTARELSGLADGLPVDFRLADVLMTHGVPGDPFRLLCEAELPGLLDTLPDGCRLLLSGHNHAPWRVAAGGRMAVNPGSLGMLEDGVGGRAPFAVLTVDEGPARVEAFQTTYDLADVRRDYIAGGCAAIAPEMCRAAFLTMAEGRPQYMLKLVAHARQTAERLGLSLGDRAAWAETDRTWPWPESIPSDVYWVRCSLRA